jgi:hypothetical protein
VSRPARFSGTFLTSERFCSLDQMNCAQRSSRKFSRRQLKFLGLCRGVQQTFHELRSKSLIKRKT